MAARPQSAVVSGKFAKASSALGLKRQNLPVIVADKAGFAVEIGDAVIGMTAGAELPTDLTGRIVLDDGVDYPGAAGRGICPGQRLALQLAEIGGGDGVAHSRFVGHRVGGRRRIGNRAGGDRFIDLGGAEKIHTAGGAAGK